MRGATKNAIAVRRCTASSDSFWAMLITEMMAGFQMFAINCLK